MNWPLVYRHVGLKGNTERSVACMFFCKHNNNNSCRLIIVWWDILLYIYIDISKSRTTYIICHLNGGYFLLITSPIPRSTCQPICRDTHDNNMQMEQRQVNYTIQQHPHSNICVVPSGITVLNCAAYIFLFCISPARYSGHSGIQQSNQSPSC